ncbi:hypothetical protein T08_1059 [Trichinella sp. T8]|nr:hypothetical protein T08_1059 [Trichinella sp. T8]
MTDLQIKTCPQTEILEVFKRYRRLWGCSVDRFRSSSWDRSKRSR